MNILTIILFFQIEKWEENTSVVNVIGTVGAFGVASSAVGLIVAPPVTFVGA